jgi:hypothetical protein
MALHRPLAAAGLLATLLACTYHIEPGVYEPPTPSVASPLAPQSRPITVAGKLHTMHGQLYTGPATVRVTSVTPHNPFTATTTAAEGAYAVPNVPTATQVRVTVEAGSFRKGRVETLIADSPERVMVNFGGPDTAEDRPGSSYALDAVWCRPDPDEEVYAIAQVPTFQASEIPAVQASEIPAVQASPIQACVAHPVRAVKPAGVDRTPVQGPFEAALVGRWTMEVSRTGYVDENRQPRVIEGSILGVLRFESDGRYTWGATSGKAEQVLPRNGAAPNRAYWRVVSGGGLAYYVAATANGGMEVLVPGTNLAGGTATRGN